MHTVCDSLTKSIGSLLYRSTLRTLDLSFRQFRGYYYDWDTRIINEINNVSIMNLIKCPLVKPKLEQFIISPIVPISSIYEFVNMNFNLKSLTISCDARRFLEETNIEGIIRILDCDNGLDEIDLGRHFNPQEYHLPIRNADRNGKIYRDEFPRMISILKSLKCSQKMNPPISFKDLIEYPNIF